MTKGIYTKKNDKITLDGEKLNDLKVRNKTKMSAFTTSIEHYAKGSS